MKRFAIIAALGLVVLTALLWFGASTLPDTLEVSRSATIDAPATSVEDAIADLRRWPSWSPWWEPSHDLRVEFGERTMGPGASMRWDSDIAPGSLVVVTATPGALTYRMIVEPDFASGGTIRWQPAGDGRTSVSWEIEAPLDGILARISGAAMSGKLGNDMDVALENLNRVLAEHQPEGRTP